MAFHRSCSCQDNCGNCDARGPSLLKNFGGDKPCFISITSPCLLNRSTFLQNWPNSSHIMELMCYG